jgi:hypothetical protein
VEGLYPGAYLKGATYHNGCSLDNPEERKSKCNKNPKAKAV